MPNNTLPGNEFPDIYPPGHIRILGAGRFGRMAAERLRRRFPDAFLLVTDKDPERIDRVRKELGIEGEVEESIRSITRFALSPETWLVPAVPVHVVFEWLLHGLNLNARAHRIPVPEKVGSQVPNPIHVPSGTLYASFATTICPDTCSEPPVLCTRSGKPRLGNLFEVFGSLNVADFAVMVLRSWQLAPGVGGFPVVRMNEMLATVASTPGKYLIGTSCRCHGVIDALEWDAI